MEIVLRSLTALVLFGSAALIAYGLRRFIPDGRVKRVLYARHAVTDPRSNAFWYLLAASIVQFSIIDIVLSFSGGEPIFLRFLR